MKKIILSLAILCSLIFLACSDDDSNGSEDMACQNATTAATEAAANLPDSQANNYEVECIVYKQVLEDWKTACGDTDGAIQGLIDDLGDCSGDIEAPSTTCLVLAQDAANAAQAYANDASADNCNAYKAILQALIDEGCYSESETATIQAVINSLICS